MRHLHIILFFIILLIVFKLISSTLDFSQLHFEEHKKPSSHDHHNSDEHESFVTEETKNSEKALTFDEQVKKLLNPISKEENEKEFDRLIRLRKEMQKNPKSFAKMFPEIRLKNEIGQDKLPQDESNKAPPKETVDEILQQECPKSSSKKQKTSSDDPPFLKIPAFTRKDKNVRPKYAILSMAVIKNKTQGYQLAMSNLMASFAFVNKVQYCKKHGYDFIFEMPEEEIEKEEKEENKKEKDALDENEQIKMSEKEKEASVQKLINPFRPVHWSKLRAVRKWLPLYDWIWFQDLDTLIVDFDQKIETLVDDFLKKKLVVDLEKEIFHNVTVLGQDEMSKAEMLNLQQSLKDPSIKEKIKAMQGKTEDEILQLAKRNFKKQPIDMIITHDWNNLNSGSYFIRNCFWSLNFLRRASKVSMTVAQELKFNEQAAFIYLTSAIMGRTSYWANKDREHMWIVHNNFFNSYPAEIMMEFEDTYYAFNRNQLLQWKERRRNLDESKKRFRYNDWLIHFPSCKFHHFCVPWIENYFWRTQCMVESMYDDEIGKSFLLKDLTPKSLANFKVKKYAPPEKMEPPFPFLNETLTVDELQMM